MMQVPRLADDQMMGGSTCGLAPVVDNPDAVFVALQPEDTP